MMCELCGRRKAVTIGELQNHRYGPWLHVCEKCFDERCIVEEEYDEKEDKKDD